MNFLLSPYILYSASSFNNNYLYHIQGHLLATCSTYKDLGVIVSNDLKPAEQIAKCVAKANQMVGMIRRTFSYIDKEIFLRTYKVFVRPILEYCQQSWAPYLVKDIEEIEKVQQRATKLVPELRDMPYEDRLRELDLFSLSERRKRGDMIFLYKIFNNLVDIEPSKIFNLAKDTSTRGHPFKIYQERSKSDIRHNFYTQRVVAPWNSLPQHIVLSKTVTQFKWSYDKYTKTTY